MATVQEQLLEARSAYHDLQIGKAVASVRDQNGEEIRYTQASRNDLLAYIGSLQNQVTPSTTCTLGPMRFSF
jgi:hypothetical protein